MGPPPRIGRRSLSIPWLDARCFRCPEPRLSKRIRWQNCLRYFIEQSLSDLARLCLIVLYDGDIFFIIFSIPFWRGCFDIVQNSPAKLSQETFTRSGEALIVNGLYTLIGLSYCSNQTLNYRALKKSRLRTDDCCKPLEKSTHCYWRLIRGGSSILYLPRGRQLFVPRGFNGLRCRIRLSR